MISGGIGPFLWGDLLSWKHPWRLDRLVRRASSVLCCSLDSVAEVGDGGGGVGGDIHVGEPVPPPPGHSDRAGQLFQ